MADNFDAQKEAAALQGAIARVQTLHAKVNPPLSSPPLFKEVEGVGLLHRDGHTIRPPVTPLTFGKKAK